MRSCLRLLVLLALLCPTVVSAASAAPAPRGTIAYSVGYDVWTVQADGSRRTRLTRNGRGHGPTWSGDGRRLLFDDRFAAFFSIMRPDGSGARALSLPLSRHQFSGEDPAWARDGRIAFVGLRPFAPSAFGRPDGIWVMNEDGSSLRRIVEYGYAPAWSPDGARIAYTQPTLLYGWPAVAVVSADGGTATRIAGGASPAWSPDGRLLAFVDNSSRLTVANVDGSEQRAVVELGDCLGAGAPTWSPDGAWLAYLGCRKGKIRPQLFIVRAAGGTPRRVTPYAGSYGAPDWRPVEPARR